MVAVTAAAQRCTWLASATPLSLENPRNNACPLSALPPTPQVHRAERALRKQQAEVEELLQEREDLLASEREVEADFIQSTQVGGSW